MLHDGRLTTSRMAPILGIYESVAMSKLGVPRSLCGHHKAMDAYYHLVRAPCRCAVDFILPPHPRPLQVCS